MRSNASPSPSQYSLKLLLAWTVGGTVLIFLLLELWRPCYFLTDDNLSLGFPILTEMGRAMKAGHSPFYSQYLFGGHYNYATDLTCMQWHPFLLLPALLADTFARFWIVDVSALLYLLLTTVGFVLLVHQLRRELAIEIPNSYLIFYTLSFVFSTYILTIAPSWLNFLGNQSALPWLALGIFDRKAVRGAAIVALFSVHEFLTGYPPLAFWAGLSLTLFAFGVAWSRRSFRPLITWGAGNIVALAFIVPYLIVLLKTFSQSSRDANPAPWTQDVYAVYMTQFPSSFLLGNWTEPILLLEGDAKFSVIGFPFLTSLFCCAAAWCLVPALFFPTRWRILDASCGVVMAFVFLLMIRPHWLAVAIHEFPYLRTMRWPFREGMLFLFFAHLLLVLRFHVGVPRLRAPIAIFSLLIFLLPMPFMRPPTLRAFYYDRELLLSGKAEKFWAGVKTQLKPRDQIFTVVDGGVVSAHWDDYPYTLVGTYNYPAFLQVPCISGYSPTASRASLPLKFDAGDWYGSFNADQVAQVFKEKPDLKMIQLESIDPLRITMTTSSGVVTDLTPYAQAAGIERAMEQPKANPPPTP